MWEVTLKILLIPRPSVHTRGFIRCTYTVRGLFGSKFHKCKFVSFSVISYIPHVVCPTPDLPTHGKFWSPLPVAIFTASMRTATRLCWAISCYLFSPCCYCVPARHPRSPVGSRRTYKTCQHVPNHTRPKPVAGDTTGSGQHTQPGSRFLQTASFLLTASWSIPTSAIAGADYQKRASI